MNTCWRLRMTLLIWAHSRFTHSLATMSTISLRSNCDWWNVRQYSFSHNHFKRLSRPQRSFSVKWMGDWCLRTVHTHPRSSGDIPIRHCPSCYSLPTRCVTRSIGIGGTPSDFSSCNEIMCHHIATVYLRACEIYSVTLWKNGAN